MRVWEHTHHANGGIGCQPSNFVGNTLRAVAFSDAPLSSESGITGFNHLAMHPPAFKAKGKLQ
jgi:hypothetical protein